LEWLKFLPVKTGLYLLLGIRLPRVSFPFTVTAVSARCRLGTQDRDNWPGHWLVVVIM
jgi:hypothetical protein